MVKIKKLNGNGERNSASNNKARAGHVKSDDGTKIVKDSISSLLDTYFLLTESTGHQLDLSFRP